MAIANFTLANRLHAGETVYSGWCGLPYPHCCRNLGARRLFGRHHRKPARPVGHRRHSQRHRRGAPGRRGADRARSAQRFRFGEPRARLRRRRHHRADDQHAGRRARICRGGEISADRRAQLGPAPRDDIRRPLRSVGLSARSQRQYRYARHDRDPHRAARISRQSSRRQASTASFSVRRTCRSRCRTARASIRCRKKSRAISTP